MEYETMKKGLLSTERMEVKGSDGAKCPICGNVYYTWGLSKEFKDNQNHKKIYVHKIVVRDLATKKKRTLIRDCLEK